MPFDAAFNDCVQAAENASLQISGAEARTRAAIDDWKYLKEFERQVELHMRDESFQDLPGLKLGRDRLPDFHRLTVGPWRGIFLIKTDPTQVVGLVFSKLPHHLEQRLNEIADRYLKKGTQNTDDLTTGE